MTASCILPPARFAAARAVLFDLDGTLIDSAPDLAEALQILRRARQLDELPYSQLRPHAGAGARGLLGAGMGVRPGDEAFESLRQEFLDAYERIMLERTQPFAQVPQLLERVVQSGMVWGIVTNKLSRFALPVVKHFACLASADAVVAGDTTPYAKPHPAPLLEAARRLNLEAFQCIYVGDDARDVQAGRAAGMPTVAACYGYLGVGEQPADWGADVCIEQPLELLQFLPLP